MDIEFTERPFWTELKMDIAIKSIDGQFKYRRLLNQLIFSLEFHLILFYRIQRRLLKIPLIGKYLASVLYYLTSVWTSCQISQFCVLEGGISVEHATGIVIRANIKSGTKIYQNVTIGMKEISRIYDERSFPKIGSNVVISAGAVVLGAITVGDNSIIGANAVVLKDVPENSMAVGVPARLRPLVAE